MSSFDSEMTDENHGTSDDRFHTDITNNRLAENSGLRAAENEVIRIITKVSSLMDVDDNIWQKNS